MEERPTESEERKARAEERRANRAERPERSEDGEGKKKKEFSILYVDDEAPNLRGFKSTFRKFYNVFTALNGEEALEILKNNEINIVVSDHRMPEMNGTELLLRVHDFNPEIRRMILSGFIKIEELKEAVNQYGIHHFVTKPWDFDNLQQVFEQLLGPNPELLSFKE
jgi:response regulator RpfG family c-di-GMP phosphodiesterase